MSYSRGVGTTSEDVQTGRCLIWPEAFARLRRRRPVIDKRGGCGHPDGAVAMGASGLRAMTTSESAHPDEHARYGACNAPAPVVPLGAGPRPDEPARP